MRALILALSLTVTCGAQAEVYKCTDKTGRKHYQDLPCADDQRTSTFDPQAGNVTTIDSETVRRETQGALLTREASRERRVEVTTPAAADTQVTISGPDYDTRPYYDGVGGYPVYDRNDRRRGRGDRGPRQRPDETPMQDTSRGGGGNYVPAPPTIRQVAPRSPTTSASTPRERGPRTGGRRDEDRDGRPTR